MTAPCRGTVVFDLDGTLVDSAPDLGDALDLVLGESGLAPVGLEAARGLIGNGIEALVRDGFAARGVALDPQPLRARTERFLKIYTGRLSRKTRPYPGAEDALRTLRLSGWRLVVCTNKLEASARGLLADLGLLSAFALVAGPDTFGVAKPDPDHVRRCLPGDGRPAVMVGDSPVDLAAGRGAGLPVVLVGWGYARAPVAGMGADAVAHRFAEVPDLVARLAAADRPITAGGIR